MQGRGGSNVREVKAMGKKFVFTKKRKAALAKARSKWKHTSKRKRAKAMPGGKGPIRKR